MRTTFWIVVALVVALGTTFAARVSASDLEGDVVVFDGWGTPTSFVVSGRVLEGRAPLALVEGAGRRANLKENLKALESDEIGFAEVQVAIAGRTYRATTDDDGNFTVQVKDLAAPHALPVGAVPVTVSVVKVPGHTGEQLKVRAGSGHVFVYDAKAAFTAIVSDIDDTIVKTRVTERRKMIGAVLLANALQLEAVGGAAAAYGKAQDAGVRGFFYLSGSPQNFHPRLQSFLASRKFPAGPLLLKNFGEQALTKQRGYKLGRLEELLAALPNMNVILIGDTGEEDPEIYTELRKRHPHRVQAIVMRKTPGTDVRPERLPGMATFDDAYPDDAFIARLLSPPPSIQPAPSGGSP